MTQKRVEDLVPGDLVDLEGDPYAKEQTEGDFDNLGDPWVNTFEFEFIEVESILRISDTDNTPGVLVHFVDIPRVWFPREHLLTIDTVNDLVERWA